MYHDRIVDYDTIYNFLEGWCAYARNAHTYKLGKKIFKEAEERFNGETSSKGMDRYKKHL